MIFKNLDYIIKSVMNESWENTDSNYVRYLQLAAMCARESNFSLPINIKTIMIPYDRQKRYIDLPPDCVDYTKIGILAGDRVEMLGLNKNIANSRNYDGCGIIQPLPLVNQNSTDGNPNTNDFATFFYNYYYNGLWGAVYGYGALGNNYGEYDYDPEFNRINLSAVVNTDFIYLEYKSNGIQEDGTILIPEQLIDELVQCLHWRRLRFKKGENAYDKERARKDFIVAKKATRRKMGDSLQDYYDASFTAYTQGPK